jgi:hypothetical protein
VIDKDGQAYHAYGVSEEAMILVRPDGYVGLTEGMIDQEAVVYYLHSVGGR